MQDDSEGRASAPLQLLTSQVTLDPGRELVVAIGKRPIPADLSRSERRRQQSRNARELVRHVLQPHFPNLRLRESSQRGPSLAVEPQQTPWWLSLSHAGDWVAMAASPLGALGIDIEAWRQRDMLALADFAFHPRIAEQLRAAPAHQQLALGYGYWTLIEAHFKRAGIGIAPQRMRSFLPLASQPEEADLLGVKFRDQQLSAALALPAAAKAAPMLNSLRRQQLHCSALHTEAVLL